jgi:hypothetical protein
VTPGPGLAPDAVGMTRRQLRAPLYAMVSALLAVVLYLPLLGRTGFASHEGSNPYVRVLEHLREVQDGHWLPQTYPDLFLGAGYAFPRFYPPLANTVASALTALTGDVVAGVHLSYLVSIVLSALAMYALLAGVVRDRLIAAIGVFAYVSFPYRFQEVFVRGALAECWTFVWYPLILLGGWRIQEGQRAPWYLPLAIAGLLISHPQMTLYFAVIGAVLLLSWRGQSKKSVAMTAAGAALLALGLSAWYWLPQQYYLPHIWASVPRTLWAEAAQVQHERVRLVQALIGRPERNGMSLWVGAVGMLANGLALYGLLRPVGDLTAVAWRRRARWLLAPWWLLFGFMLAPGIPLAVLPKAFGYIQFPWRALGPMGFFAAASVACSLAAERSSRLTLAVAGVLIVAVFSAGLEPYLRPEWTGPALERRIASRPIPHGLTSSSEYLPRSVPGFAGPYIRARSALNRAIRGAPYGSEGVVVLSLVRRGSTSEVIVESRDSGVVTLPLIYYDFYRAESSAGRRLTARDSLGLLTLTVAPGRQTIRVAERLTLVSWLGLAITAASCLAALGYAWRRRQPVSPGIPFTAHGAPSD